VGASVAESARAAALLGRDRFDVDRFPSAKRALALISSTALDVLLVRYPLPEGDLGEFLDAVMAEGCPSRHAPLVLLTSSDKIGEAEAFIGRGVNRVLRLEASERSLQWVVADLLDVAPRKSARFTARLEVTLGEAKETFFCQTANVSTTGMLLETERHYEPGTRFRFQFRLPSDERPGEGVAEVVRRALRARDEIDGLGVRFVEMGGDSKQRLLSYLKRL